MTAATTTYLREPGSRYLWVLVALGLLAFAAASGVSLALGELQALYITMALALCIAVMYDFRIGVVALVAILPLQDSSVFPHALMGVTGLNPQNLVLAATLASYFAHGRVQHPGRFAPRPLVWLYVVPIAIAAGFGATHVGEIAPYFFEGEVLHFDNAAGYLRDLLVKPMLIVVLALLLGAAAATSQKPERFIVPIAVSVWLIAALEIGFVVASGVKLGTLASAASREFFTEIGLHANDLGRLFAVAYALLLFPWWETRRPGPKLFLFLTLGVLSIALLLTFSRGAFAGFLLVNLLFLAWKFNLKTLGLAVLAFAICASFAPGYVISRITLGFDSGDPDEISAGRIEGIWLPLLPTLLHSPVWGSGLLSTTWSLPMTAGSMLPVSHPHNAYLETLLDMGLAGLALILAFYWSVWRGFRALGSNAWLSPEMRGFFQGGAAALVCFLVTGMAGSSLRPESEFAYLWLAIGMMYGVAARKPAG
ncbi:MAG: O-antigen ligase family protein [Betaproteobacteria bacterium]